MGSTERLCLRWNDFESNIKHGFSELRAEEEFFDVTLACGSQQIKAHKVILSACSPFFRSIIKSVPHDHPLLYLRGVKFNHLESLLSFMYNGEVNVTQEELNNFLSVAEELKIKGLTQSNNSTSSSTTNSSSNASAMEGGELLNSEGLIPPPSKRPRVAGKPPGASSPNPSSSNPANGPRSRLNRPQLLQQEEDDDDIQDITASVVKSEPKSEGLRKEGCPPSLGGNSSSSSTMVVTPDLGQHHGVVHHHVEDDDPYAQEEDNYEDYAAAASYGSESGEMGYSEMDPGLVAVPGPSGAPAAAPDGNKGGGGAGAGGAGVGVGGGEAILALDSAINLLIIRDSSGFTCKKCGKTSSQRTCLRNHIEAKHIQTDGFRCTVCSRVFKTRNSLSVHTSTKHTNATPYISGTRGEPEQLKHEVYDV